METYDLSGHKLVNYIENKNYSVKNKSHIGIKQMPYKQKIIII